MTDRNDTLRKDAADIKTYLSYDPDSGHLTWKERDQGLFTDPRHAIGWNKRYAGRRAFTTKVRGYFAGSLFDKHIYAHRAAWAVMHGEWPVCIDHINGDKTDNRATNLRNVMHSENMRNKPMQSQNTSGVIGISYIQKRDYWVAHIGIGGKTVFLGNYATEREAMIARAAGAKVAGYHDNHGRALIAEASA